MGQNSDLDQFIFPGAQAYLFGVLQAALPVGGGARIGEVVVVLLGHLGQMAVRHDGLLVDCVHAGLVQRHRVKAGEHAHIGHDGHVVFGVAVAVGGHVDDQAHMELGTGR